MIVIYFKVFFIKKYIIIIFFIFKKIICKISVLK